MILYRNTYGVLELKVKFINMQHLLKRRELKTYWMIRAIETKNPTHQLLLTSFLVEFEKRCN